MPEVCGRICPQDRLCEGNCVIEQSGHGTVTIDQSKNLSLRMLGKMRIKPLKINKEINLSVGIIGAGPAHLACAEQLRNLVTKLQFMIVMIVLEDY